MLYNVYKIKSEDNSVDQSNILITHRGYYHVNTVLQKD